MSYRSCTSYIDVLRVLCMSVSLCGKYVLYALYVLYVSDVLCVLCMSSVSL